MLTFVNNQLCRLKIEPVLTGNFEIINDGGRMKLIHEREEIQGGITWYGYMVDVNPHTGELGKIHSKNASIRAVFGGTHLDRGF